MPIRTGPDADEALAFAETLGQRLAKAFPKVFTMESRIADRKGWCTSIPSATASPQTVVAPYSVRRRAKAPFSRPLAWKDVRTGLDPTRFNLGNYARELRRADPWKDFWKSRQPLRRAMAAVKKL